MSQRLLRALNWLVVLILCWAAVLATFSPGGVLANQQPVAIVLRLGLAAIFMLLLIGLKRWQACWSAKVYRRCLLGITGLIVVMQLIVALSFVDVGRADAFWVRNQAIALAQGQQHWASYFQTYPNNVNLTLVVAGALKLALKFGLTNPWVIFNIGRFLWIDTGLIAGLVVLRRWHTWRPGALGLLLAWLLAVPIYAYALFDYTDAWVLPLVVDTLALGFGFKQQSGWRRWGLAGLTWSLLAFGVVIKSNLIVLWLATGLIVLVAGCQHQLSWRTAGCWLLGSVVTLGLFFGGMSQLARHQGYRRDNNQALPVTSWVAMSLNPQTSGDYDEHDFEMIRKQPTSKAKQQTATRLIKTRLGQLKLSGLLLHWAKKMSVFYATGDFDSFRLTTQWLKAPRWFRAQTQTVQFWLATLTQSWYLCLLIGSVGSLLRQKQLTLSFSLLSLTILGFTVFHVGLWEVESRYALPLLPVLMILASHQWTQLPCRQLTARARQRLNWVLMLALVISGWQIWQTRPTQSPRTSLIARQGNGSYFQAEAQAILPQQRVTIKLPALPASNRLRLSPTTASGLIRLRLKAGKQTVVASSGSPAKLRRINYPMTKQPLTIHLTNVGKSTVQYAAVKANYDQLTGKILSQPTWFMQLMLQQKTGLIH